LFLSPPLKSAKRPKFEDPPNAAEEEEEEEEEEEREGRPKHKNSQTDRQGSKRFQLSQFCCVLSEIKNRREGDIKKRRLLSSTRSGAERNERSMQQER
jgi:hypothetical protein